MNKISNLSTHSEPYKHNTRVMFAGM